MNRRQHSLMVIATIGLSYYGTTAAALAEVQPASSASAAAATNPAAAQTQPENESADWPDVSKRIAELVKQYYPKAHIEISDRSIHFEYNVKQVESYYGEAVVPQSGGILGDIELKGGDKPVVMSPQETKDGSTWTTTLSINPYSYKNQMHLATRLTYPSKESKEFKEKFSAIVTSFKSAAPEAPAATTAAAAVPGPPLVQPPATTGPLLQERKLIADMIAQIKGMGENVANYVQVQKYIEDRAAAGATQAELEPTVTKLVNELSDFCLGKIKPPVTLEQTSTTSTTSTTPTSSNSPAQPAASGSGKSSKSGKSAAQQYIDETRKSTKKIENEHKKNMSKEFWQKFHDEGTKPKT